MARYKSRLKTDFDPMTEGQRLRDDPERGNVESIQELRNRPDPEGDAFLRGAARDASFKGDVGFGATKDKGWGVNPRTGASRPEPQGPQAGADRFSGLDLQFGGTDFTARGAAAPNALPGPNTRTGNMPPAGSGAVEPFTAHGAGRKFMNIGQKAQGVVSAVSPFVSPQRAQELGQGYQQNVGQPFTEAYQQYVGRPFEDFARGATGAAPLQLGESATPGIKTAVADTSSGAPAPAPTSAPTGDPEAFRGGRGPGYGDVSQFLTDDRSRERARNDPVSGNPQGGPEDFMRDAYTGGADETGAGGFGAPGSSGTPGPGGTVSTISSEAFMSPGGRAAGDAAVGRARRDFQLRQEGNAHLASDATPEEKIAARTNEIQRELNNINLGTNQSFSQLANNRARASRLEQEMAAIQGGQAAAAERGFEARESERERQAELEKTRIENQTGTTGNLKVGGTMEALRHKYVTQGPGSFNPQEKHLFNQELRQQAIDSLLEGNLTRPEDITEEMIENRMDLYRGQLVPSAEQIMEAILNANPDKTKDDPEVQQIYKQNLNRFNLSG